MNILVTLDKNYLNPLATLLNSLLRIYKNEKISVYVAHTTLEKADFTRLRSIAQKGNMEIFSVPIPQDMLKKAPRLKRLSREAYYRLFAPLYLPKNLERILYIDPDTLILRDFSALYNIDFEGKLYVGASHLSSFVNRINTGRLHMPIDSVYLNSGILMMNLKALRTVFSPKIIFDYIEKHERQLLLADQDVLNAIYANQMKICDETLYNLDERTYRRLRHRVGREGARAYLEANTCILHYDGKEKPWNKKYKGELDVYYPHGLPQFF